MNKQTEYTENHNKQSTQKITQIKDRNAQGLWLEQEKSRRKKQQQQEQRWQFGVSES